MSCERSEVHIEGKVYQAFNKKEMDFKNEKTFNFKVFFKPFDHWIENNFQLLEANHSPNLDSVI